jgi:Flp pilus assembly protein protease CpaA
MLIWLFIIILMIAVLILIVLQFRKEQNSLIEKLRIASLKKKW